MDRAPGVLLAIGLLALTLAIPAVASAARISVRQQARPRTCDHFSKTSLWACWLRGLHARLRGVPLRNDSIIFPIDIILLSII